MKKMTQWAIGAVVLAGVTACGGKKEEAEAVYTPKHAFVVVPVGEDKKEDISKARTFVTSEDVTKLDQAAYAQALSKSHPLEGDRALSSDESDIFASQESWFFKRHRCGTGCCGSTCVPVRPVCHVRVPRHTTVSCPTCVSGNFQRVSVNQSFEYESFGNGAPIFAAPQQMQPFFSSNAYRLGLQDPWLSGSYPGLNHAIPGGAIGGFGGPIGGFGGFNIYPMVPNQMHPTVLPF